MLDKLFLTYTFFVCWGYTRKSGVVYDEIILPENAPLEFSVRATLWNTAELAEKRIDSQLGREINIALPIEFDRAEQINVMREYIERNFTSRGMCADLAIHDKKDGNPHAHIMLTTRHVTTAGFGGKNRDWNNKALLEDWRKSWAEICNIKFKEKGLDERIDHRTLEAQGIERIATKHHYGRSEKLKRENEEIKEQNEFYSIGNIATYMHELKKGYLIAESDSDFKEAIKNEYQRLKILAEVRADKAKLEMQIKQLDKSCREQNLSIKEYIAQVRSESILDTIAAHNCKEIMQDLPSWKAEKAREYIEREQKFVLEMEMKLH